MYRVYVGRFPASGISDHCTYDTDHFRGSASSVHVSTWADLQDLNDSKRARRATRRR